MYLNERKILVAAVCLAVAIPLAHASSVELHNVQFPERSPVGLSFEATPIAPSARVHTEVTHRRGQARIELSYEEIKPAILFGGDVTCYVVWAVTRDGQAENLGELLTRKLRGRLTFSTGKKNFALMVTAESFYLVGQPSELVVFKNRPSPASLAESAPFTFDGLRPAPRHSMDAIAHIKWDSKVPLELLQARKAFELATRHEAADHAAQIHGEAEAALATANKIAASAPKSRDLLDSARRAVALSNEALNISMHRLEAMELERQLAQRREETAALERRAAEAEAAVAAAERLTAEASDQAERARAERERMVAETGTLRNEKVGLETAMLSLRQEKSRLEDDSARLEREKAALEAESRRLADEKTALEGEAERLRQEKVALGQEAEHLRGEKASLENEALRLQHEKDQLAGRLQSALSHVADTEESVRGFVINLPDILFGLNEADLKPETRLILAKLAGILLVMPDQDVLVEGHTDSTGSVEYNLDLSQRRALAVLQFLQAQGLQPERLRSMGYGMQRPVADNSSTEGRRRNRRVEIVISARSEEIASN
jgi:outer membrane protein OmpA-like peptidoglycan-associated protein